MAPKHHTCATCGEDFESPEQLDQHTEDNHGKEPRADDESPET